MVTGHDSNYNQAISPHMAGRGHCYICSLWGMIDRTGNVLNVP